MLGDMNSMPARASLLLFILPSLVQGGRTGDYSRTADGFVSYQGSARSGTALCPARQRQDSGRLCGPARAAPGQDNRLCVLPGNARTADSFVSCQGSARTGRFVPARQRQVGDGFVSCQGSARSGGLYVLPGSARTAQTVLCPARQRQVRDGFMCPTR